MGRVTIVVLLLVLGCAHTGAGDAPTVTPPSTHTKAPAAQNIYLWEVQGSQGNAWILGSVHVMLQDSKLDKVLLDAFHRADSLAVEVDIEAVSAAELETFGTLYSSMPKGESLARSLGETDYKRLLRLYTERELPTLNLDRTQPWVVSQILLASPTESASPPHRKPDTQDAENHEEQRSKVLGIGVDQFFINTARAEHRTIHSLETLKEQGEVLSSASMALQIRQLRGVLDALEIGLSPMQSLIQNYESGELESIEGLPGLDPNESDLEARQYGERMVTKRNHIMATRLKALMQTGQQPFVVVGALHVIGEKGLPALLETDGFRVRRVNPSGKMIAVQAHQKTEQQPQVLGASVEWPGPPVDLSSEGLDTQVCELNGARFVLTQATIPMAQALSLSMLYEQARHGFSSSFDGAKINHQAAAFGPFQGERFQFKTKEQDVLGLQVFADQKLYVFMGVIERDQLTQERIAQRQTTFESFHLDLYDPVQGLEAQKKAADVLASKPDWLHPFAPCPKDLMQQATLPSDKDQNACLKDFESCVRACEQGAPNSCLVAADLLQKVDFTGYEEITTALYARACKLGSREGCAAQVAPALFHESQRLSSKQTAVSQPNAQALSCMWETLTRGCADGDPESCVYAGIASHLGTGATKDQERAKTYLDRACQLEPMSKSCVTATRIRRRLEMAE